MNKKLAIYIFSAIVLITSLFRLYLTFTKDNDSSPTPALLEKVNEVLKKYPVEAQRFHLTKTCQDIQKPIFESQGIVKKDLDILTLPVCTCISSQVMKSPKFQEIENFAKEKKEFSAVLMKYKDIITVEMDKCAGPKKE